MSQRSTYDRVCLLCFISVNTRNKREKICTASSQFHEYISKILHISKLHRQSVSKKESHGIYIIPQA